MPGNSCVTDSNPPHTNGPINNHPTYHYNVSKFGFPSWTASAAEKPLDS